MSETTRDEYRRNRVLEPADAKVGDWAASHLGGATRSWYVGIWNGEDLIDGFTVEGDTAAKNALWSIDKHTDHDAARDLADAVEALREIAQADGGAYTQDYQPDVDRLAAIAEKTLKKHGYSVWPDLTAEGGQRLTQAEAERDDALAEARRWKGHHETQVRWKRRGHERMKAHYEAKVNDLEARAVAAEAKAALADEQYGEGKVRSHAYWKARYDAITAQAGEQHASNQP